MTNVEKELLIAYLVDAGDIDPDGYVETQFLEWRQVREQVVPGEAHYRAVLEAARIRGRAFDRGYRLADVVRWTEGDPPALVSDNQGFCDHDSPCGCYAEEYAADMAAARAQHYRDNEETLEARHRVMDSFHRAGN